MSKVIRSGGLLLLLGFVLFGLFQYQIKGEFLGCQNPRFEAELIDPFENQTFDLEVLADEGDLSSQLKLGHNYLEGVNNYPKDRERAKHYYRLAADQGSEQAQFRMGYLHQEDNQMKQAIEYYETATLQNHDAAHNNLGMIYLYDLLYQDYEKAKYHLEIASQSVDASIYHLGQLYADEKSSFHDYEKANGYFKQVLTKKSEDFTVDRRYSANYQLAKNYKQLTNYLNAEHYYLKAAELKPEEGYYNLAHFYRWEVGEMEGLSDEEKIGYRKKGFEANEKAVL